MKIIPLTQGVIAIVDDHQFEKLNKHKWYASSHDNLWYAVRKPHKQKAIRMHREILGATKSFEVDHIHRDDEFGVIDNREVNLRPSTRNQNGSNLRKRKNCSSIYKGVSWNKDKNKWEASIRVNQRGIFLGRYHKEKDAAFAYDRAAKKYFGVFAHLNFTSPASKCFSTGSPVPQ